MLPVSYRKTYGIMKTTVVNTTVIYRKQSSIVHITVVLSAVSYCKLDSTVHITVVWSAVSYCKLNCYRGLSSSKLPCSVTVSHRLPYLCNSTSYTG